VSSWSRTPRLRSCRIDSRREQDGLHSLLQNREQMLFDLADEGTSCASTSDCANRYLRISASTPRFVAQVQVAPELSGTNSRRLSEFAARSSNRIDGTRRAWAD
jgi:hypothetical protein